MKPANEKRSFYRIRDIVGMSCALIGDGTDALSRRSAHPDTPLGSLLEEIDREFNKATNTLWLENPVFAQALGLLNRKLSIITAHTLPDEGQQADVYEELVVSISGSGIGFDWPQHFAEGSRLRISLVLKPSNIMLQLTGSVTGCQVLEKPPEQSYWVRVAFEDGNETAQEQLIQHIVQRQCAQMREQMPA